MNVFLPQLKAFLFQSASFKELCLILTAIKELCTYFAESNPNPQERGGDGEDNLNIDIDTGFNGGRASIEYEDYIEYPAENSNTGGNQGQG